MAVIERMKSAAADANWWERCGLKWDWRIFGRRARALSGGPVIFYKTVDTRKLVSYSVQLRPLPVHGQAGRVRAMLPSCQQKTRA